MQSKGHHHLVVDKKHTPSIDQAHYQLETLTDCYLGLIALFLQSPIADWQSHLMECLDCREVNPGETVKKRLYGPKYHLVFTRVVIFDIRYNNSSVKSRAGVNV